MSAGSGTDFHHLRDEMGNLSLAINDVVQDATVAFYHKNFDTNVPKFMDCISHNLLPVDLKTSECRMELDHTLWTYPESSEYHRRGQTFCS